LADLLVDQPAAGRRALANIEPDVLNQPFESPRYFLWISELRQELYEGNANAAWRILESGWPQFIESPLSNLAHYKWVANSLRVCCCLASVTNQPERKDLFLKDANATCKRLNSIPEPLFAMVAKSQELVVKAAQGTIAPRTRWAEIIELLRRSDMSLFAVATAWHASIYWPDSDFTADGKSAEQIFRDQDVAAPDKLMQLILPLPD
jgi:hypothetical protein